MRAMSKRTRRRSEPARYDHGPEHRFRAIHATDGTVLRPADLVVVDAPDPAAPKSSGTIRRARVRDPVRAMVAAGAPYRILLAAERFRLDIEQAAAYRAPSQLRPRITVAQMNHSTTGREPPSALMAKERAERAWKAIGLTHSGIVSWCVVPKAASEGHTFGTLDGYAECKGMRRQRASDLLAEALSRLADHYNLGHPETPREIRLTREG